MKRPKAKAKKAKLADRARLNGRRFREDKKPANHRLDKKTFGL